jgi:tRNA threonylcarbamoyladenosine biosynthesis protein TsaB
MMSSQAHVNEPRVLAIDTATDVCSVACTVDGQIFEDTRTVVRLHNAVLLEMLENLCSRCGSSPRAFDAVVFNAGPGSFTGMRIAAATSQAIAMAADAQVLPISASWLLANTAVAATTAEGFVTLLASRRNHYYVARYATRQIPAASGMQASLTALELREDDALVELDARRPLQLPLDWQLICGHAADALPGGSRIVEVRITHLLAAGLAGFIAGAGKLPAQGLPRYVVGDTPWRAK